MKKRLLAGLITHQYKKLPVTMKMWMQFNVKRYVPMNHECFMLKKGLKTTRENIYFMILKQN